MKTTAQILKDMMEAEKMEAITTIMHHYKQNNPELHTADTFNTLYDSNLSQLNDILSDCISEIYQMCNKHVNS